jgi:hypothetical protein
LVHRYQKIHADTDPHEYQFQPIMDKLAS